MDSLKSRFGDGAVVRASLLKKSRTSRGHGKGQDGTEAGRQRRREKGKTAMNYKMILAYDGARYDGWQKQGNTERTIQGKLEAALGRLTGETVELQGAGRTDAGVHARGQAASFHLASERDCRELLEELNRYLPEDLAVLSLERAPERFHARLNALGKRYRYQLAFGSRKPVFERKYLYREEKPLDFEAMEQAARYLEGTTRFPLLLRQPADEKIHGADPLPHRTAGRSPAGPGGPDLRGRRVSVSHGADPDGDPAGGGDGKAEAGGDPGDPGGPGPGKRQALPPLPRDCFWKRYGTARRSDERRKRNDL